jgi:ABC-type lipoprotein export system ATPase subunit
VISGEASSSRFDVASADVGDVSVSKAASAAKVETDLPRSFLEYLDALQAAWSDLPELTITYENLAYSTMVPAEVTSEAPSNLYSAVCSSLHELNVFRDRSKEMAPFHPLHQCSGIVKPGQLTLVLAPPGHGRSVLLKSLSGRTIRDGDAFQGEVRWNGLTASESDAAGQQIGKLCAFVEQGDVHFPMLTVRETLQFALDNSNASSALLGCPIFHAKQREKVELMLELLGLKECADTVVGDTFLRGVSGGTLKRHTRAP